MHHVPSQKGDALGESPRSEDESRRAAPLYESPRQQITEAHPPRKFLKRRPRREARPRSDFDYSRVDDVEVGEDPSYASTSKDIKVASPPRYVRRSKSASIEKPEEPLYIALDLPEPPECDEPRYASTSKTIEEAPPPNFIRRKQYKHPEEERRPTMKDPPREEGGLLPVAKTIPRLPLATIAPEPILDDEGYREDEIVVLDDRETHDDRHDESDDEMHDDSDEMPGPLEIDDGIESQTKSPRDSCSEPQETSDGDEILPEVLSQKNRRTPRLLSLDSFRRTPARIHPQELMQGSRSRSTHRRCCCKKKFWKRGCFLRGRPRRQKVPGDIEAVARRWLRITTRVHFFGGSIFLFAALVAYVVFRENSAFPVNTLKNCVVFRAASLAFVVVAAKSCKGHRLRGRKVLLKLPQLLLAKTVDCGAALLTWLALLPLLTDISRHRGVTAMVLVLGLLSLALDVLGGLVSAMTLRRLCAAIPDIAANEVDEEMEMSLFDDDDFESYYRRLPRGSKVVTLV